MKSKKASMLLPEETTKAIIGVIVIIFLVYLGIVLYNIFKPDTELKNISNELTSLKKNLESLSAENLEPKEHTFLDLPELWYIFSATKGEFCKDPFCICMCKTTPCGVHDQPECISTNKYTILKRYDHETVVGMLPESPMNVKIRYIDQTVYPYDALPDTYIGTSVRLPRLFYKFEEDQWIWSPDLENWMPTTTKEVSGGYWDGYEPAEENTNFFENVLADRNEIQGQTALQQVTTKSEGVYVIEI